MPDVILASKTADIDGYIELTLDGNKEALIDRSRRVTVTPTLDGGGVVDDGGFAQVDRGPWDVRAQPSRVELETLKYLLETYGQLNCVTREGVFTVAAQRLSSPSPLLFQMRLLIVSKDA
jgi:hypothetical protein